MAGWRALFAKAAHAAVLACLALLPTGALAALPVDYPSQSVLISYSRPDANADPTFQDNGRVVMYPEYQAAGYVFVGAPQISLKKLDASAGHCEAGTAIVKDHEISFPARFVDIKPKTTVYCAYGVHARVEQREPPATPPEKNKTFLDAFLDPSAPVTVTAWVSLAANVVGLLWAGWIAFVRWRDERGR